MHISPDIVVTVIFGVIMMIIGITAIWIVHWQTGVLMREQRREFFFSLREELPTFTEFSVSVGDIERAQELTILVRSETGLNDSPTVSTLRGEPVRKEISVLPKATASPEFVNQAVVASL
jgi:hypothetical protein